MRMKYNAAWILTAVGGICLGAAAVGVSQQKTSQPLPVPAAHAPDDLSTAFREVAAKTLPAVVSISTEVRPHEMASDGGRNLLGPQEEMFRQFFGNDPRFEEFFKNQPQGRAPTRHGAGSGFIIDSQGIILTNSHVVEGADRVTVKLYDGHEVAAESWNYDPRSDVAIVRIKTDKKLPALTLGDSNQMQIGDWVLALGNPFNVGTTVTSGIISATGRGPGINEREEYLQTDAAINPGNSGGPLVNLFGEVVGINTAISTRSGGYDGIGFAIPSKSVRWVADQLIQNGEVKRSYMGVALQPLTGELREQLNVPWGQGALISEVLPETPAAAADLQAGDVILSFNGKKISDRDELVGAVEQSAPNKSYKAVVLRNGKEITVEITLKPMPGDYTAALRRARTQDSPGQKAEPENHEIAKLGLEVTDLTDELAEQLGVKEEEVGVVIRNVKAGSPADNAGLQTGDLIQRVGQTPVRSVEDFRNAVKDASLTKGLLMHINRGGNSAFIVVKDIE